jgi:nicotinamidase-related amidase
VASFRLLTKLLNLVKPVKYGDKVKPALLVVDIQNAWLDMDAGLKESMMARIPVVNEAIGVFRGKGLPIIRIYHVDPATGPKPGTPAFEFDPDVRIEPSDELIVKNYPNAFNKTELEEVLRRSGCDTVILAGLSGSGCVLATYLGAVDRDIPAYLVKNAVAAPKEEHVRFAEEVCDTLSLKALRQFLG